MTRDSDSYLLCVRNEGYEVSLERRKVYQRVGDPGAAARSLVRVVDESGEDYLYPVDFFVPIDLPANAAHVFEEASA